MTTFSPLCFSAYRAVYCWNEDNYYLLCYQGSTPSFTIQGVLQVYLCVSELSICPSIWSSLIKVTLNKCAQNSYHPDSQCHLNHQIWRLPNLKFKGSKSTESHKFEAIRGQLRSEMNNSLEIKIQKRFRSLNRWPTIATKKYVEKKPFFVKLNDFHGR